MTHAANTTSPSVTAAAFLDEPPATSSTTSRRVMAHRQAYDAWLTVDMLKSGTRTAGMAVRLK